MPKDKLRRSAIFIAHTLNGTVPSPVGAARCWTMQAVPPLWGLERSWKGVVAINMALLRSLAWRVGFGWLLYQSKQPLSTAAPAQENKAAPRRSTDDRGPSPRSDPKSYCLCFGLQFIAGGPATSDHGAAEAVRGFWRIVFCTKPSPAIVASPPPEYEAPGAHHRPAPRSPPASLPECWP
jgi:hypothetical protein